MRITALPALATLVSFSAFAEGAAPLPKDLPPYGPEKPLQAPAVKSATLDNGLTVWLVSKPGLPKIAFSVAVRGGFAADPADRPGLSELLTATIDQGTKTRNAREVAQQLQAAGGDLSADAHKDYLDVSTAILSSKLDAGLSILADVVQNATFPDSEVELAKRNTSDSLKLRESDPSFLASRAMARALFRDHPYQVTAPTQASIAATTAGDLRAAYSQRFRPDQAAIVAVGDFDNGKLLDLVKAKFKGWKSPTTAPLAAPARISSAPSHSVFFVSRPGSVQTTLSLGGFAPLRGAPDYEAVDVANAIYGGTFSSRLVLNIREDKGYTYSPASWLATFRSAGMLQINADVRNEVTGACFNEMLYELNRMATTSPTEEELSRGKRYLVGNEAIGLQSRPSVAHELANIWVKGLPPDEIGNYGKKVSAITVADVDAAGRKYFSAARTAIVVVGEEKVVREALEPFNLAIQPVP